MRKFTGLLLFVVLCIGLFALAYAEGVSPSCYAPILRDWNAKDEKELQQNILKYWKELGPREWSEINAPRKQPVSFRLGGTTKELIATHKDWDIAIVSSKDADLQKLADEGLIINYEYLPHDEVALHQWLLPKAVQEKLPDHPLFVYAVFCYDYDAETDEAIFLICNKKNRPARAWLGWAMQILKGRSADTVRALEGVCRVNDWTQHGVLEKTVNDLLNNPNDWDWVSLRIDVNDHLEALDQADLLYDFSQNVYWTERKPDWLESNGLFSMDSRMIGIPYNPIIGNETTYEPNTMLVFIVNAKSANLSRALEYAKHFVKSYEWIYDVIKTGWSDPEIEKNMV